MEYSSQSEITDINGSPTSNTTYGTSPSNRSRSRSKNEPFCVAPPMFSRQSSIISNKSVNDEQRPLLDNDGDSPQVKRKLIQSKTDVLVLISMALIYFTGTCAFSVIAPFFAPEAKKKGANGTITGLIFAVFPLIVFLLSPIVGKLLPVIGPKFALVAGCFIEAGSEILFGFVCELESGNMFIFFCFAIRIVTAVGSSCSQTAILSIVSTIYKDNLSTMFGILELFSGLGFMAGPALGGVLYEYGGFKLPFVVVGSILLFVLFCVTIILPGDNAYRNQEGGDEDGNQKTGSIISVVLIPGIMIMCLVAIIGGMVLSFLDPTLTNHLNEVTAPDGISNTKVGLVFLIPSTLYALVAPPVGMVIDKKVDGRYMIILGHFICCISYLFLGPSKLFIFVKPSLWIVCVALAIAGIGIGPYLVPVLADMQKSAKNAGLPDNLATTSIISGIFNSVFSIGSVIGPTLGGALTDGMGFQWASTIFAFTLGGSGILLLLFTIWEKNSRWSGKHFTASTASTEEC